MDLCLYTALELLSCSGVTESLFIYFCLFFLGGGDGGLGGGGKGDGDQTFVWGAKRTESQLFFPHHIYCAQSKVKWGGGGQSGGGGH